MTMLLICAFKDCDKAADYEISALRIIDGKGMFALCSKTTTKDKKVITAVCENHLISLVQRDWSKWLIDTDVEKEELEA